MMTEDKARDLLAEVAAEPFPETTTIDVDRAITAGRRPRPLVAPPRRAPLAMAAAAVVVLTVALGVGVGIVRDDGKSDTKPAPVASAGAPTIDARWTPTGYGPLISRLTVGWLPAVVTAQTRTITGDAETLTGADKEQDRITITLSRPGVKDNEDLPAGGTLTARGDGWWIWYRGAGTDRGVLLRSMKAGQALRIDVTGIAEARDVALRVADSVRTDQARQVTLPFRMRAPGFTLFSAAVSHRENGRYGVILDFVGNSGGVKTNAEVVMGEFSMTLKPTAGVTVAGRAAERRETGESTMFLIQPWPHRLVSFTVQGTGVSRTILRGKTLALGNTFEPVGTPDDQSTWTSDPLS